MAKAARCYGRGLEDPLTHNLEHVRHEVRDLIRAQGLRATASRIAVLVALHEHGGPMTHEQVMDVLTAGAYDKASVWRILADLTDHRLLRRMDLGDRVWRYELHDACRPVSNDHAHFLCESCGDVRCLPPLLIHGHDGALPSVLEGAEFRLRVVGRCQACVQV